ncbi:hypothetical protein ACFOZ0_05610 [Streptomyces yaanensis]|uniref:Transcriptional regulator n=1 Tax=Streptomyces yaanensis TaxID=1142239 RepID=A0ABV7S754_9ACTN|nr:hypothetical protein [Streptomyces sp. CGMCC 4.7035]WNC02293.1 hypothetical protein Q2K21_31875 [Streptomyces sp. CGMCC 4.7035]
MTTVRTPSPPPLPVRQRTQIPSSGLSPMLSRLAAERATGVLMRERGTLYLADGQVVHAESPATPGLDVLLIARGALDEDGWREAVAQAGSRQLVGRFLVDSGRISEGALELCHLGALYDAAYFVLGPSSAPARFRYGAAHWLGPVRPVPVAAVERETLRRRELLRTIWSDPATDEAPLIRADHPAGPAVTPRQEAVLDRVDGVRTAADISRALGRPAFHTLVDVRRLTAAGVVAARRDTGCGQPPAATDSGHTFTGPMQAPPARTESARTESAPTESRAWGTASTAAPAHGGAAPVPTEQLSPFADPHITLLKRLRDALEAL